GELECELVCSARQSGKQILAVGLRDGRLRADEGGRRCGNGNARENGALSIAHEAGQPTGSELRKGRRRRGAEHHADEQNHDFRSHWVLRHEVVRARTVTERWPILAPEMTLR